MNTEQIKYDADILFEEMNNDFDRYPLPVCFDPYEEVKELNRRELKLRAIAERFVRIKTLTP